MTHPKAQGAFDPFPFLSDGSLNVHKHVAVARTLVVFVHGFMGDGYETWGEFPRLVFDKQMDVGVFDYPTGLDRGKRIKTPSPESSARFLSQEISLVASEYDDIFLLGHSMGGLVAALAAHHYFSKLTPRQQSNILPLAGLLAFASPLGGSTRFSIPGLVDMKFLSKGNRALGAFRAYRDEKIDIEISEYPNSNKYSFPMASLSGMNDVWVKRTNSALGIPPAQAEDCHGSHTELVKPTSVDHKSVQWTARTISQVRLMRQRAKSATANTHIPQVIRTDFVPGVLVAKLWDTSEPQWVRAFTDALALSAQESSLTILDARSAASSLKPNLVVHAMHAWAVLEQPDRLRDEVVQQLNANSESSPAQVALGPTGPDFTDAEGELRRWLLQLDKSKRPWVEGAPSADALRDKIVEWIRLIARTHLHTASSLPSRRRADALDSALGGGFLGNHSQKRFGDDG